MKHIQKITQKAIVEKDGKVLFLKDPKGLWELPVSVGWKAVDLQKRRSA